MKIIKEGKIPPKPTQEFTCENCGTIFIAELGEYYSAGQLAWVHDGIQYQCECPVCKKFAYK